MTGSETGRPEAYVWGTIGPSGYDCEGWARLAMEDPEECARRLREVAERMGSEDGGSGER